MAMFGGMFGGNGFGVDFGGGDFGGADGFAASAGSGLAPRDALRLPTGADSGWPASPQMGVGLASAAPTAPGFNDPGGLGEKLGMAGSAILGAYNGGGGALNLDALRKLHQPRGGGVQRAPLAPPIAMPDTRPSNSYLQIDPFTGQYRSTLGTAAPI